MGKLTKRFIEAAPPKDKAYILWDGDIPGFGVRVMPSGRKAFVLQYRIGRRSRTMSLGYTQVITPDKARGMAIAHLAAIEDNRDPLADRDDYRKALTVRELAQRFEAEHIAVHLKPLTAAEYRRALKKAILPCFGRRLIAEVSREEIARFRHKYRHVPYFANRCLAILSKMFNLAELWGLRADGSNPCRHIRKYKEERRERFLSAPELRRVGQVLAEMEAERVEMASALVAIRLLILTGCRLGEILTLKWEHVDCDGSVLNLPDSKTGAKAVYLGQPAVEVLRTAPRLPDNPWVIWGRKPGAHLYSLQDVWERVRARAGLIDLRIHDLRHTFASAAVAAGQGLPMIGKLLGHTQVQTTARYAHLAADPVKAAAEQISAVIAQAVGGEERDKAAVNQ
ncbi:MAG: site-specific integrase [Rhodospirillales bacterium]|nr:site-specific integrase [Rhodospirillales bacterium]